MEAEWSQSPVLPWARLAYDACLNAGSTAVVLNLEPPPGVAPSWLALCRARHNSLIERGHRWECFGDVKLVSLTGFAPVISCMRGRRVGWATPQGRKWCAFPVTLRTQALI